MEKKDTIIKVENLTVDIKMDEGILTAVRGVNFTIERGKTLGLVGESGTTEQEKKNWIFCH